MTEEIQQKLSEIESTNNVKILFACESGSRAWGFPSPDSDFDVRFVYIHAPDAYLSIDEKRDVIELPVNEILDISGWDIRKALKLFYKSNAPLYEWMQSPILYRENFGFLKELLSLAPEYFCHRAGMHHYLSMAANCFKNDLQKGEVRLKKYFYALRPILAARWIAERKEVPPMEFHTLLKLINDQKILLQIDALLKRKLVSNESEMIVQIAELNDFIQSQIEFCEEKAQEFLKKQNEIEPLNELFRQYVFKAWNS
ncbi:MAG: nucleotidyltransferase domain-containing protein [Bacteroidota bacterium]